MNLVYYRNFITIVECGSISAASRKLLIAQPALSTQLKALERELGVELLERSSRHIALTDAGRILYEKAKDILRLQDDVINEIAAYLQGDRGTLSIGITSDQSDILINDILIEFHKTNPEMVIELYEASSEEMAELLKNGTIEVAFIRNYDENNPAFHVHASTREHFTAVYRRGNLWLSSALVQVPLKMLKEVPLSISREFQKPFEDACYTMGFSPKIVSVCGSSANAILWANSGMSVAIVSETLGESYEIDDTCYRIIKGNNVHANRSMITLEGRQPSNIAKAFIEYSTRRIQGALAKP